MAVHWAVLSPFPLFLSFLIACLYGSPVVAQYDKATTTDAAGNHIWTPLPNANPLSVITISSTAAASQPTLVWNCQQMPSICTNMYNFLRQQGGTGNIQGALEMVYDMDSTRTSTRRGHMCNSASTAPWGQHRCPDTNLPVPNKLYDPLPAGYDQSFYYSNLGKTISGADYWIIPGFVDAQGNNVPSGLMYTCDEFPPASWVGGGDGEDGNSRGTIICAASSLKCLSNVWSSVKAWFGSEVNAAEQDWQGQANSLLRSQLAVQYGWTRLKVASGNNPFSSLAAAFQFTTTTLAAPGAGEATTRAFIIKSNDPDMVVYSKRDEIAAEPTVSYWTERFTSSQHIVIGAPAQTPKPTKSSYPFRTTITESGTIRVTGVGGPTVGANETMAITTSATYTSVSRTPSSTPFKQIVRREALYTNVTQSEIKKAEALVKAAINEQSAYNKRLFGNPRRNVMKARDGSLRRRDSDIPNYKVNSTVAAAAALLAELQAAQVVTNLSTTLNTTTSSTSQGKTRRDSAWWMDSINHNGMMAFNANSSTYPVWRNVVSYGADPTGALDSTAAINKAISDGFRCGSGCNSSSVTGALVYFPPGKYLVSSSIVAMYNTQLIGDPTDPPTILAASSFVGLGVISSDVYIDGGNGAEWYINQNNFFRQVRNFIIDIRQATVEYPAGLHWQVAQATSLQNIQFIQNTGTQQGIFAENGSGGFMSDLVFTGGNFGMYGGNQQFTVRNLKFTGCTTAIGLIWDWGWTWKGLDIENCGTGINMIGSGGARNTGSVYILDSTFTNTNVALLSTVPIDETAQGTTDITLDNVQMNGTPVAVQTSDGSTLLAGGSTLISFWAVGRIYNSDNPNGAYINGSNVTPLRPNTALLRGNDGGYFAVSKPQYESYTAAEVVNVKTYAGAAGDGSTDDTHAIQSTLDDHKGQDVIIFFPAGTYIVTDTVVIPEGAKIVGEVWSQIMASGDNFGDMTSPRVMVQVGNVGDVGSVEIQDMLFTTKGGTAGAVLVEWNIQASSPGSAAMWDSHFRVGGALGNELQLSQCPTKSTPNINSGCIAASMLLHLTSSSSAYLENIWAWTADHDMDDSANTMIDVYSARGILIESKGPTWLYGTASEHNVLYQYELYEAENIFMGMIQTESPYYPPVPSAPAPFDDAVGVFNADPNFTNCNSKDENSCAVSWALRMVSSSNVQIAGAGLYSWYQDHDPAEACVDAQNCQQRLVSTYLSSDIWLYNLITIGVTEMISPYGTNYSPALAAENTDATGHPYWSTINAWLLLADGATGGETPQPSQTITLADWWWGLSTPSASCWFPCVIVLPPVILPPMQAPVITSLIKGIPKTITPPAAETPTLTVDPITISGTPSISNAPISTSVTIQFNHSAIILPPFEYTDDDDDTSQNISGIIIPLPIKGPPPRSNSDDDSMPGSSSSNCWFLCDWPPKIPSISISNSSPWPKPDTPEPPGLDNNNNDVEDDGSGGGTEDGSQPQEPESTSTTSTTSSTTTTTTTTTTPSPSGCTAIPTIAIATDGISFSGTGTSGASASAWASSYPTVTNDPVFGAGVPVAVGGTYTPTSQYSIATNPGTSSSTTATTTTSSVKSPPTDSAGGQPRYDILYFEDDSNPDSVTGPVMQNQGHESYTDEKWDVCKASVDWEANANTNGMPDSLTGITVFGDTCAYMATAEWESASDDAKVGKLTCSEWSDATCYKSNVEGSCLGDILVVDLVYCGWST